MITVEQIRDWSNENARNKLEEKIEEYVDSKIKQNLLNGKTHAIRISTGSSIRNDHFKNDFYDLWCNDKISDDNLNKVKANIIKKYRSIGLEVDEVQIDEGHYVSYPGLRIIIPDELLEDN